MIEFFVDRGKNKTKNFSSSIVYYLCMPIFSLLTSNVKSYCFSFSPSKHLFHIEKKIPIVNLRVLFDDMIFRHMHEIIPYMKAAAAAVLCKAHTYTKVARSS